MSGVVFSSNFSASPFNMDPDRYIYVLNDATEPVNLNSIRNKLQFQLKQKEKHILDNTQKINKYIKSLPDASKALAQQKMKIEFTKNECMLIGNIDTLNLTDKINSLHSLCKQQKQRNYYLSKFIEAYNQFDLPAMKNYKANCLRFPTHCPHKDDQALNQDLVSVFNDCMKILLENPNSTLFTNLFTYTENADIIPKIIYRNFIFDIPPNTWERKHLLALGEILSLYKEMPQESQKYNDLFSNLEEVYKKLFFSTLSSKFSYDNFVLLEKTRFLTYSELDLYPKLINPAEPNEIKKLFENIDNFNHMICFICFGLAYQLYIQTKPFFDVKSLADKISVLKGKYKSQNQILEWSSTYLNILKGYNADLEVTKPTFNNYVKGLDNNSKTTCK